MSLPDGLMEDVKNRLNITWDDEATNRKIAGIVEQGVFYLNDKLGAEADYTVSGYPQILLMEYCRYVRDEALDVFESNYLSFLLAMQNERAVRVFAEASNATNQ